MHSDFIQMWAQLILFIEFRSMLFMYSYIFEIYVFVKKLGICGLHIGRLLLYFSLNGTHNPPLIFFWGGLPSSRGEILRDCIPHSREPPFQISGGGESVLALCSRCNERHNSFMVLAFSSHPIWDEILQHCKLSPLDHPC